MIETERLIIRPFTEADLPRLIEMRSDPEVNKYLGGTRLQNPEAIGRRMKVYMASQEKFGFSASAVIWKETGEMIGWGGLMPLDETGEIEIGYGMIREFWGRGVASEIARACVKAGFENHGLERIVALAIPGNTGSTRVMEKLGMKYEKTAEHFGEECEYYAVSREEFMSNR